jgi:lipid-A-disaccharide synthase
LAKHAYELGLPVYYYISPKVWAWKEWRIKSIRRYCRKVLSILPFEVDYFHRHNMEVVYVGNPSVEEIEQRRSGIPPCDVFRRQWSLDAEKPLLALVPGSRVSEIKSNLPIMNAVAQRYPQFQAVVAAAPNIDDALYAEFTDCKVVKNATFNLVGNSTCALVTSGTATLETAILGVPQVVCYRNSGSKLFYDVMKHFIKCPYISLPNLIADKAVVPEMLMHLCTADSVSAELGKIVPGAEGRDAMLAGYALMRERLGRSTTAAETAAKVIVDELSK